MAMVVAMDMKQEIAHAELRIRAAGLRVERWCRDNHVSPSSWYRWRAGAKPDAVRWHGVKVRLDMLPIVTVTEPRAAE